MSGLLWYVFLGGWRYSLHKIWTQNTYEGNDTKYSSRGVYYSYFRIKRITSSSVHIAHKVLLPLFENIGYAVARINRKILEQIQTFGLKNRKVA